MQAVPEGFGRSAAKACGLPQCGDSLSLVRDLALARMPINYRPIEQLLLVNLRQAVGRGDGIALQ